MVPPKLNESIQELLPAGETLDSVQKLFGEASYREYFRVRTQSGRSYILMKMPAGKQSVSEEITNYSGPKAEIPFVNVARYLETRQIPAPRVLASGPADGLLLLQDLGDVSLESLVAKSNGTMVLFFYKQAVDLLLRLQKAGADHPDKTCMAFNRSFDRELLEWEFRHFLEYGIEDRFSLKIPDAAREEMLRLGQELIAPITQIPYGLTHRDFQSRNLILFGYELYLIDFQDALLGPPQYDLVALLRDSYVKLPKTTLETLLDAYLEGRKKIGLPDMEEGKFKKNFFRITLQRKLKDAGRFQFIKTVKKNDKFMVHVPTSLEYVKDAFARLPEYAALQKRLAEYVPELR